ncbi:MAG TPA: DUF1549 and DUF1553 domain-containing protein [Bryobacteraceae bacterium]|nr:DUF1549 and DUF1553 domain-containing protein [Bryobacteraceae bacterium]
MRHFTRHVTRHATRHATTALLGLALSAGIVYTAETDAFTPAKRSFWSLQPVKKAPVPAVQNQSWVKNPIDSFVLAKLEEASLQPNPPADRLTLLRRATIDMTGLPPTQEEIQQFLSDQSANAWEKVVDRLLASPAYGERWARHWLDVARYADSNGFKADETRPNIWRYRDYVIDAFNTDKPYDRFIKEQIAGDELYPGDPDALVAMGFNRHWIDETNAAALFTRRQETLDDMTTATGEAFMGLTFGCARCHNHKFDPILQKDYYRLQAFFANTSFGDGPLPLKDPAARQKYEAQKAEWEAKTKDIRAEMNKILEPLRAAKIKSGSNTFEEEVKAAIMIDPAQRDPLQSMMYHTAEPRVTFDEEPDARTLRTLKGDSATRYADLKKQLAAFDALKPAKLPEGQFMIDIGPKAPPTHVLRGGNFAMQGEEVQPGFLSILDPADAKVTGLPNSTGRRTALAAWLTDPKNPLVARVMVNRIWHYNFGTGIVATPGDFGRMGARPTHPELLDYLSASFVENGWSVKKLQRQILLSNTYQQSADLQAKAAGTDPDNKLLWRWPRRRMEAEAIRDSMLFTSGLLNTKMGGPGVFPPVPAGTLSELSATAAAGGWKTEKDIAQANRRSVYIFVRRNLRYPMLQEFDSANTFESCDFRKNTVTPSQSLDLLNNDLILQWAQSLAGRVLNDSGLTPDAQVDRAFKLTYGRAPSAEEQKLATDFLARQMPIMAQRLADAKTKPPLPNNMPAGMDPARAAALVDLSHMLLDSNQFLYIN